MPSLGLSTQEIADVIAFLDWMGHIDTKGWPPRPILVSGVAVRAMPGVAGVASAAEPASRGKTVFNGSGYQMASRTTRMNTKVLPASKIRDRPSQKHVSREFSSSASPLIAKALSTYRGCSVRMIIVSSWDITQLPQRLADLYRCLTNV